MLAVMINRKAPAILCASETLVMIDIHRLNI